MSLHIVKHTKSSGGQVERIVETDEDFTVVRVTEYSILERVPIPEQAVIKRVRVVNMRLQMHVTSPTQTLYRWVCDTSCYHTAQYKMPATETFDAFIDATADRMMQFYLSPGETAHAMFVSDETAFRSTPDSFPPSSAPPAAPATQAGATSTNSTQN